MFSIHVVFVASELFPGMRDGHFIISDNTTILDLLSLCEKEYGASLSKDSLQFVHPLFNGKFLPLDSVLSSDGTLHLCRIVVGG